ncbi:hypothetical protein N7471_001038 [Penicillium samsonianum]|uniref:uncharacterized protein n=1 Tax=Penicillium samsonianum TaxID=1882272 RepID=UPI0025471AE4|nr:uncharacterized protein N7471_001038 [Penicillium samsonianum]KAJ6149839.1 hypothetical protein N7471_001038 [Penicillium samsonianum]
MIILDAEDAFKSNEDGSTEAIIPSNNGWTPPSDGKKVIVGVASIKLEPSSKRLGQFNSNEGKHPELPPNLGRDLNKKHYNSWGHISSATKKRYCLGFLIMDMLVVHPAYWKRGHGTKLVN